MSFEYSWELTRTVRTLKHNERDDVSLTMIKLVEEEEKSPVTDIIHLEYLIDSQSHSVGTQFPQRTLQFSRKHATILCRVRLPPLP
jgi:hypothetical protein